jgi:hypothetical protein
MRFADVPPFKLAQMMADAADKEGAQYQRLTWDALRKSINGLVNKARAGRSARALAAEPTRSLCSSALCRAAPVYTRVPLLRERRARTPSRPKP